MCAAIQENAERWILLFERLGLFSIIGVRNDGHAIRPGVQCSRIYGINCRKRISADNHFARLAEQGIKEKRGGEAKVVSALTSATVFIP